MRPRPPRPDGSPRPPSLPPGPAAPRSSRCSAWSGTQTVCGPLPSVPLTNIIY